MNIMLLSMANTLIICGAVAVLVVLVYFIAGGIKKREKKEEKMVKISGENFNFILKDKYMYSKELKFYYLLKHILPKGYIVFPKVGVDNLVESIGSREAYNIILSKYVDFVVFQEATMKAVLAIDIFDATYNNEEVDEADPNVVKALKAIKLPFLQTITQKEYDIEKLRSKINDLIIPKEEPIKEEKQ